MNEQSTIELIKLWTGWFGQLITISSGLMLVLVAFREKIFPPHPTRKWLNWISGFFIAVSLISFLLVIFYALGGQLSLMSFLPGATPTEATATHLKGAMTNVSLGFLVGIAGFMFFVSVNLAFAHEKAPGQKSEGNDK